MNTDNLRRALEEEHPCEANCCDVAMAMREGLYLWAAHIFVGAMECPETDREFAALDPSEEELEAERERFLAMPHVICESCHEHNWHPDEIEKCASCLAVLGKEGDHEHA
jgi:hypothetical protein